MDGASVSGVTDFGIDPGPVGERVVEAVKDGDLYVFTHPEFKTAVAARFDRILAAFDKPSSALASLLPREVPAFLAGGPPEN